MPKKLLHRGTAAAIALSLIWVAPGCNFYSALAQQTSEGIPTAAERSPALENLVAPIGSHSDDLFKNKNFRPMIGHSGLVDDTGRRTNATTFKRVNSPAALITNAESSPQLLPVPDMSETVAVSASETSLDGRSVQESVPRESAVAAAASDRPIGNTAKIRKHLIALFQFFRRPAPISETDEIGVSSSETPETNDAQPESYLKADPSQGPPVTNLSSGQPPAPPLPLFGGDNGGGSRGSNHPWRTAILFTLAAVAIQAGYEAWGATWPNWVRSKYGVMQYSTVAELEMVARVVSGFSIGWVADKFGARKSMLGTIVLMTAASTMLLLKAHSRSLHYLPLVFLAFTIKFAISSIGTLQQVFPVAIFKGLHGELKKFNPVYQFIQEIAGIAVPLGIGSLLLTFGPLGTMTFQPITLVMALAVLWAFVRISEQKKHETVQGKAADSTLLKIGAFTYPPFLLLNFMLYSLIAIGYGTSIHPGTSDPEVAAATGLAGKITGYYSLGGLSAMIYMMRSELASMFKKIRSWIKQKLHSQKQSSPILKSGNTEVPLTIASSADEVKELRSTARWLGLSALGLGTFVTFLFHNPLWAKFAMIPFGFTQAMSFTQLITLTQSNVPQDKKGKIIGAVRTAAAVLAIGGLYLFGRLFEHFPANAKGVVFGYFNAGAIPFLIWLGLLVVIAAYFFSSALRLNRYVNSPAYRNKSQR